MRSAGALAIPATYATAFGFIFSYGKLLEALSQSGLVPEVMGKTYGPSKEPYVALLFGSGVSYCICLLAFYNPVVNSMLFNLCMMCAYTCYLCQCMSFIHMRFRFVSIDRVYHSPLGIPAAVFAGLVFTFGLVSVVGFQGDDGVTVFTFACILAIFSAYYFLVVVKTQHFSKDEATIMFKAYVINANYYRKRLHRLKQNTEKMQHFVRRLSFSAGFNSSVHESSRESSIVSTHSVGDCELDLSPSIGSRKSFKPGAGAKTISITVQPKSALPSTREMVESVGSVGSVENMTVQSIEDLDKSLHGEDI